MTGPGAQPAEASHPRDTPPSVDIVALKNKIHGKYVAKNKILINYFFHRKRGRPPSGLTTKPII